jgi:hypothetical protein
VMLITRGRSPERTAPNGDHRYPAGLIAGILLAFSVGIFVMTCGRRHRVQAQGLALPLRSVAGLA